MKSIEEIRANLDKHEIETYDEAGDGFMVRLTINNDKFGIIGSWGVRWDHVSISLKDRCPTWEEMSYFKDLFFNEDEVVMQLHPPKKRYINNHPYCLHLWKPQRQTIPLPPNILVGIK